MSIESLAVRPVTIQTANITIDRYNNTVLDWSSASGVATQAWLAQTTTAENRDHRDATIDTVTATFVAGTVIDANDRVVIDGAIYEVVGKPNQCWTPRGLHHIECQLQECVG